MDRQVLDNFVAFAVSPNADTAAQVPFGLDGVRIGLASNLMATIGHSDVARPAAWALNSAGFRGGIGPVFPLEAIADHVAKAGPDATFGERGLSMTLGEHPHCASGPVGPPGEVVELRRISIQPDEDSIASCLEWFTVDLFMTEAGRIEAITYDVWEP